MNVVNLIFEVHAYIPNWVHRISDIIKKNSYSDNRYRIYVNDDLIVERNWIWDNNTFLRENICVIAGSINYNVRLEPILYNSAQIKFSLKKISSPTDPDDSINNQFQLSISDPRIRSL